MAIGDWRLGGCVKGGGGVDQQWVLWPRRVGLAWCVRACRRRYMSYTWQRVFGGAPSGWASGCEVRRGKCERQRGGEVGRARRPGRLDALYARAIDTRANSPGTEFRCSSPGFGFGAPRMLRAMSGVLAWPMYLDEGTTAQFQAHPQQQFKVREHAL